MSRDDWKITTYGQVMLETDERACEATDLPVLSVTKSRGPMLASERFGKAIHGRDLTKYRLAKRNSVVADPMLLWDGSIGLQTVVDAGLVSPDYRVYQPSPETDPRFLGYVVRSPNMMAYYKMGARGTNVRRNRIARSDFLAIPLRLPPIAEQRKIASILSSVDENIKVTKAVIDQLQVVKKAMMAELLTRGLPGRHTRFKETKIGEIPESWRVATVGDFIQLQRGYDITQKNARPGTIPVVSSGGISYFHSEGKCSPPGVVTGRKGKLGDVFLIETPYWPHDTTLWVSDFRDNDPHYVAWFLRALDLEKLDSATAVPTLNRNNVHPLTAAFPELEEQRLIANVLDSIVASIEMNTRELEERQRLKSALMSVLLTGEIRVRVDEVTHPKSCSTLRDIGEAP